MKVMLLGASGLFGKALVNEWRGDELHGFTSRGLDIRNADKVRQVVETLQPHWIVLSAAYTNVDACESDPDLAFAVNRDGAVNVAAAAQRSGAKLLFISSDYVFDGSKTTPYEVSDPRNPQSVYGRSKAEAEVELAKILPGCCIVRTSWLYGVGGKCFPDTILKLAASRPSLDVVYDQQGCPTYTVDLAKAITQLCHKGATGIVHATNAENCSWFEFAQAIVKAAGLTTEVRPISTAQMARPAPRPPYSVLSPASLHRWGIELPAWPDALHRYMQERQQP